MRSGFLAVAAILSALPAAPARGQIRIGSEFQVNAYTTSNQGYTSVAMDPTGGFLVVWQGAGEGDLDGGVFGRRFAGNGAPLSAEFRINAYTTLDQRRPVLAMDRAGRFVVIWNGLGEGDAFGGKHARRFDAAGMPQGAEFQVNSYTGGMHLASVSKAPTTGSFVVVWSAYAFGFPGDGTSYAVFGRLYDAIGTPQGPDFLVNSYTTSSQRAASVAMDPSGAFVVVWNGSGPGDDFGIFARRFDPAGNPQGPDFQVNSYTTFNQRYPMVASDPAGGFVVVWGGPGPGDDYGIFGRRFDAAGMLQGTQFRVNSSVPLTQTLPNVTADPRGGFIVVWTGAGAGDQGGIFARRLDAAGTPQGSEFLVNSYTEGFQRSPDVDMDSTGRFVVTWHSPGQDGSVYGVFAQRFATDLIFADGFD